MARQKMSPHQDHIQKFLLDIQSQLNTKAISALAAAETHLSQPSHLCEASARDSAVVMGTTLRSEALTIGWKTCMLVAVTTYVLLCRALRRRQMKSMEQRFQFKTRASLAKMTLVEAHAIQTWLAEQEFPATFSASIFFALFKTYSIPSISRLLAATGQFGEVGDVRAMSRRAADTSVLLTNMIIRPPGSRQAVEAVARTNYLHSRYRRAGQISDDDMLYTLSLFTLESMRWTSKYEWRRLTDMERCAMATCFKVWGEDLEISYAQLPSSVKGWVDGLDWLEELDAWSRRYEEDHIAPSPHNAGVARSTMDFVLSQIPWGLKRLVQGLVAVILGERSCEAMGLPIPPRHCEALFNALIAVRKFLLQHLMPPRPYFLRRIYNIEIPNPFTGRYQIAVWRVYPWYAAPSLTDRWGPRAWGAWLAGGTAVDLVDKSFVPEGYLIRDVGPASLVGKGASEMNATIVELEQKIPNRCPFLVVRS